MHAGKKSGTEKIRKKGAQCGVDSGILLLTHKENTRW